MMFKPHTQPNERIDPDHYEPSPSTGPEETPRIFGAGDGYDHEPPSDDDAEEDPAPDRSTREVFA